MTEKGTKQKKLLFDKYFTNKQIQEHEEIYRHELLYEAVVEFVSDIRLMTIEALLKREFDNIITLEKQSEKFFKDYDIKTESITHRTRTFFEGIGGLEDYISFGDHVKEFDYYFNMTKTITKAIDLENLHISRYLQLKDNYTKLKEEFDRSEGSYHISIEDMAEIHGEMQALHRTISFGNKKSYSMENMLRREQMHNSLIDIIESSAKTKERREFVEAIMAQINADNYVN